MRFKFRRVIEEDQWDMYRFILKVIDSCDTYQQLLTIECWLISIRQFKEQSLKDIIKRYLYLREDTLRYKGTYEAH